MGTFSRFADKRTVSRFGAIETSSLPDGWYRAHVEDGIMAGPFEAKRDAARYDKTKRWGPGLYEADRGWWVIHIQHGVVPGGFEVLRDDFDPADFVRRHTGRR